MKKTKLICLVLVLALLCSSFLSCADDETDAPLTGGERIGDGWEGVDFGGATITVEVSGAQDSEGTFPACNIYTRGPDDGVTSDEVQKKVLARNSNVQKDLNIHVEYKPNSNLFVDKVLEHVEKYVRGSADDAPDVLDNDIYGLTRAMMNGYLWNISNPGLNPDGSDIHSYFIFTPDAPEGEEEDGEQKIKKGSGWYTEFMQGASFDPQKLYLLAGDYNLDIIRFAWVLFTNIDLFDTYYSSTEYGTYADFVEYILDTDDFVYEHLQMLAQYGWKDLGSKKNETDLGDIIGLCLNAVSPRIFHACSGFSMVEWSGGAEGKGTPSVYAPDSEGANRLATLSEGYRELFNAIGVHYVSDVLSSTTEFFNGRIVLTVAKLGEMESSDMRGTTFTRGILPFPRYDYNSPNFITVVHDQAEVSCILNNASSFALASAYLQYLNENSADVMEEYYENGLKFKYNDSQPVVEMIEYIKDHIRSPFDSVLTVYICASSENAYQIYDMLHSDAASDKNGFASSYRSHQGSYQASLDAILTKLAAIE